MEPEKLNKSFESRYLMPAGYQTERGKFDENFDLRHLRCISVSGGAEKLKKSFELRHRVDAGKPMEREKLRRVLSPDHPKIRLHGAVSG